MEAPEEMQESQEMKEPEEMEEVVVVEDSSDSDAGVDYEMVREKGPGGRPLRLDLSPQRHFSAPYGLDGWRTCRDCGDTEVPPDRLSRHRQEKHCPPRFFCSDCGKGFDYNSRLASHKDSHTNVKCLVPSCRATMHRG
jgi:hypothetical protein